MRPDDDEILGELERVGGLTELARVHTFRGYRLRPDDEIVEVTVEILDRGEGYSGRWTVSIEDDMGNGADSEPEDDLQAAIAGVHWVELDAPPGN